MSVRNYQDISRYWFIISVSSLGFACCLAVILIVSRMPVLGGYFNTATFQSALVLHVNFSLFIWLFSFAAAVWVFYFGDKNIGVHRLILFTSLMAIFGIILAALINEPNPILSNYLPVLDNPLYLGSGILFGSGFIVLLLYLLSGWHWKPVSRQPIFFCRQCLFRLMLVMLVCLMMLPWVATQMAYEAHVYYELLFWGIGHQLQYLFTLFMLWGWIWLAKKYAKEGAVSFALSDRILQWCFYLALLPLLASCFLPFLYAPESESYRKGFTYLMYSSPLFLPVVVYALYGGGGITSRLATIPTVISLALGLLIIGLLLGMFIDGNNLMVPAHYHAVTGAINLTFMALGYELMPKIGFSRPSCKWRFRQAFLYSCGVTLLALGLAWSGHLGGVRKVVEHGSESLEQLMALVIIAVGGLVSLLACFLFLGLVFSNVRKKSMELAIFPLFKTAFIKGNQDG